jgi:hypothetical protein
MSKKPDGIELEPDAWDRFERAVDTVSKSGPMPRKSGKDAPELSKEAMRVLAFCETMWVVGTGRALSPKLLQRVSELSACPDRWVPGTLQEK